MRVYCTPVSPNQQLLVPVLVESPLLLLDLEEEEALCLTEPSAPKPPRSEMDQRSHGVGLMDLFFSVFSAKASYRMARKHSRRGSKIRSSASSPIRPVFDFSPSFLLLVRANQMYALLHPVIDYILHFENVFDLSIRQNDISCGG